MLTRKQREVQGAKARAARQAARAGRQATMARQRQIRQADRSSAISQAKAREVNRATRVAKGRAVIKSTLRNNAIARRNTKKSPTTPYQRKTRGGRGFAASGGGMF